jgi:low affinity Fe/Cu permease
MTNPEEPDDDRALGSRLLLTADNWSSRPVAGLTVITLVGSWLVASVAAGFPDPLERIFQVLVAALTLVMLFVVQHTQARLQHATQRKLDELLRALPAADDALVRLEHGSDAELRAAGDTHRQVRESATDRDESASGPVPEG